MTAPELVDYLAAGGVPVEPGHVAADLMAMGREEVDPLDYILWAASDGAANNPGMVGDQSPGE